MDKLEPPKGLLLEEDVAENWEKKISNALTSF